MSGSRTVGSLDLSATFQSFVCSADNAALDENLVAVGSRYPCTLNAGGITSFAFSFGLVLLIAALFIYYSIGQMKEGDANTAWGVQMNKLGGLVNKGVSSFFRLVSIYIAIYAGTVALILIIVFSALSQFNGTDGVRVAFMYAIGVAVTLAFTYVAITVSSVSITRTARAAMSFGGLPGGLRAAASSGAAVSLFTLAGSHPARGPRARAAPRRQLAAQQARPTSRSVTPRSSRSAMPAASSPTSLPHSLSRARAVPGGLVAFAVFYLFMTLGRMDAFQSRYKLLCSTHPALCSQSMAFQSMVGWLLGVSSVAVLFRNIAGIVSKSAEIGSELVHKLEPEHFTTDKLRNPATLVDKVQPPPFPRRRLRSTLKGAFGGLHSTGSTFCVGALST